MKKKRERILEVRFNVGYKGWKMGETYRVSAEDQRLFSELHNSGIVVIIKKGG